MSKKTNKENKQVENKEVEKEDLPVKTGFHLSILEDGRVVGPVIFGSDAGLVDLDGLNRYMQRWLDQRWEDNKLIAETMNEIKEGEDND